MKSFRTGAAFVAIATCLNASAALAQDATAAPTTGTEATTSTDDSNSDGLQEIVVVAQKRVERLSDVPVSVGVVQGSKLQELNLTNLEQVSRYVPGFTVAESASGNRITLRGISSGTNRGFEQSVGMFVDGIYTGRAAQFSSPFFDVERVEVLRGPQSILFGKNTVAGAVSIITARPTKDQEGQVTAGYEPRFNSYNVSGIWNQPITDNLQARISLKHEQRDRGILYNTLTDEHVPTRKGDIARVALAWQPGTVQVNGKYEYSFGERRGTLFQIFNAGRYGPTFTALDPNFESQLNLRTSGGQPGSDLNKLKAHNASLRISIPIGDANLTSDTGYSAYKAMTLNEDSDFSPVPAITYNNHEKYNQFSQELRFTSPQEDRFAYTLGLFFQHAHYISRPEFAITTLGLNSLSGRYFDQTSDNYSGFAEASYELVNGLRLIVGGRYMIEDKKVDRSLQIFDLATGLPETSPAVLGRLAAIFATQNYGLHQSISEKQFTPAVTLQYKINPDLMVYGKFSRGFKSGGFDASDTMGTAAPYDSESVSSFETGMKWVASRHFNLNLTGFYSRFNDLQVQAFNGISFITTNAAKASSRGVEAEARWQPLRGLTFGGSLTYLDAHYNSYPAASCTTGQSAAWPGPGRCTQDLSGRPLTDAPHWSSSVNATYEFPVMSDWNVRLYAGANARTASYVAPDLDPLGRQKGYATFDGNIELLAPNDWLTLSLLGKNITDKRAKTYVVNVPLFSGAKAASIIEPRTIEVRATVKF